jgi:hypothetical protein
MWSSDLLRLSAKGVGDRGELRVLNPVTPQVFHDSRSGQPMAIVWALPAARLVRVSARRFRWGGAARRTGDDDTEDTIENMTVIDFDLSRCRPPAPQASLNANWFAQLALRTTCSEFGSVEKLAVTAWLGPGWTVRSGSACVVAGVPLWRFDLAPSVRHSASVMTT